MKSPFKIKLKNGMILDLRTIITFVLSAVLMGFIFSFLISCSSAQHHYDKFIQKGGKIDCANDTIWKKDTTYLEGKMIIDSFPIPCNCSEVKIPPSKAEVRRMDRQERAYWKTIENQLRIKGKNTEDSLKQIVKIERQNVRNEKQKTKQIKSNNNESIVQIRQLTKQIRSENKNGWIDLIKWILILAVSLFIMYVVYRIIRVIPK